MENCKFPFICYWGGHSVVVGDKVEYDGGKQDFLTVKKDITYNELISGLYEVMELDVSNFELEVKMKYPIVRGGFRVLPLKNDRALESMWASVSQCKAPQLDLYIDVKPIEQPTITPNPSSFPTNTTFTSMISQPYTMDVLTHCRPICYEDMDEWVVIAPLIFFEVVECHLPNRCVRQFGWIQEVPELCNTSVELHAIDRRKNIQDFAYKHVPYLEQWENRKAKMAKPGDPYVGLMNHRDPYLRWYHSITLHQISPQCRNTNSDYGDHHYYYPTATDYEQLTVSNVYTYQQTTKLLDKMAFKMPLEASRIICNLQKMSLQSLQNTRQGHRIFNEQSDDEHDNDDPAGQGDVEEGEEEGGDEDQAEDHLSPPRYNFRNLRRITQPREVGESSSKSKKKSKRL